MYSITKASGGVTLRGLRASAHNALGIKKEILNTLINRIIQYIYGHKPIIKKAHRELCRARDEQRTVERQGEEAAHTNRLAVVGSGRGMRICVTIVPDKVLPYEFRGKSG